VRQRGCKASEAKEAREAKEAGRGTREIEKARKQERAVSQVSQGAEQQEGYEKWIIREIQRQIAGKRVRQEQRGAEKQRDREYSTYIKIGAERQR
jgi:hypothetical protein